MAKKNDKPKIVEADFGVVGTSIFHGIISEEFNSELSGKNGLLVYDKMRKGDGAIGGMLEAITAPLLSAQYFIAEYDKSEEAKQQADFIRKALFDELRGGYTAFLRQALTYLPFGFSVFEKIYKVNKDGFIVWDRFSPRIQSSIYSWTIEGQNWVDGHPPGITQQGPGQTDDILGDESKATLATIPWNKIILFVNKQEGSNFEGISLLRNAYKHWFFKDLLYKIQGISAERFGVGIPVATHGKGLSEDAKHNLEELLQNIRANEQAYIRLEDGTTIDLMTIKGDAKASSIAESIQHHDRKIYDSILAGFLNLTSGEGGSNALSADHSSFFSRALRGYADYHCEVMNPHIRELIDLNFPNAKGYCTLEIEGLGENNAKERVESISAAKRDGLVTWTVEDEMTVRELLGLPEKTMEEIVEEQEEAAEKAAAAQGTMDGGSSEEQDTSQEDGMLEELDSLESELSEEFEYYGRGPMPEEVKKKISDALKKNGSGENDRVISKNKRVIDYLNNRISGLRNEIKALKSGGKKLNKAQKAELKKKIGAIRNSIKSATGNKKVNQGAISDRKTIVRLEKAISKAKSKVDSAQKKKAKQVDSISKLEKSKAGAKNPEQRAKIQSRIDESKAKIAKIDSSISKSQAVHDKLQKIGKTAGLSEVVELAEIFLSSTPRPTPREREFNRSITGFMSFLDEQYKGFEDILSVAEEKYRKALGIIYNAADVERVDGVMVLSNTPNNRQLQKKALATIDDITKRFLTDKLIDSPIQDRLFTKTERMALACFDNNEAHFASVPTNMRINIFIDGYKSNVEGVLFNEPRRIKENIVLSFGTSSSIDLAKKQAEETSFNRNIYKLSTMAHAQGAFNSIVYNSAQNSGYTFFKAVVPPNRVKDVSPSGMTSTILFGIFTAAQLNKLINENTDGKNANAMAGLNIHHNAYLFYYPIHSENLDEEQAIADQQKKDFTQIDE